MNVHLSQHDLARIRHALSTGRAVEPQMLAAYYEKNIEELDALESELEHVQRELDLEERCNEDLGRAIKNAQDILESKLAPRARIQEALHELERVLS
ncbi:MAG TPA: hypothetical protein VFB54_03670 [Burkholderiales bacterium]|nr:hypothetical protein [Burkholderiales bacterium]